MLGVKTPPNVPSVPVAPPRSVVVIGWRLVVRTASGRGVGGVEWRRWTGIEPAGQGSPIPPALKAGEPTRRSDTSAEDHTGGRREISRWGRYRRGMSKNRALLLLVLAALLVVLSKKVKDV